MATMQSERLECRMKPFSSPALRVEAVGSTVVAAQRRAWLAPPAAGLVQEFPALQLRAANRVWFLKASIS